MKQLVDAGKIEVDASVRACRRTRVSRKRRFNEGWSAEQAVETLNEIDRFGIEFCEQPIPAGHPEQIRRVSERSKIPIMIDEDALEADQLARFYGGVYAVNLKLAKCGGIAAALQMIAAARALKLKVMLGCTAETRVLATAAADRLRTGSLSMVRCCFGKIRFVESTMRTAAS